MPTKKSDKKESLSGEVHVRMEDSLEKRKTILESALLSANLTQKYEDFKAVRNEKTKQLALFKKLMKEVAFLFKDFEFKELPEVKLPKPEIQEEIREIRGGYKGSAEEIEPTEKTKLERDLEDIKSKLENLKI